MKRITWLSYKLEGMDMDVVNLEFIYQLGARIHLLTQHKYTTKNRGDICDAINGFEDGIQMLFDQYPDLTVCKENGKEFLTCVKHVNKWENKYISQKGERIDKSDIETDIIFERLLDQAKKFETVLLADLQNLNIYHPLEKGGYNTRTLLSHTEQLLARSVLSKIGKNVIREVRDFGRCLAFDNYTASGFHILRALEVVLHDYWITVCKRPKNKELDSWADYLSDIYYLFDDKTKGNKPYLDEIKLDLAKNKEGLNKIKKVYYLLQQIKYIDRNKIMHTETILSQSDALALFDTVKTVMKAMAEKLPNKKP